MISNELQDICSKIGQFYLQKNNQDYEATAKEIQLLKISNVEILRFLHYPDAQTPVHEESVQITCGRPGLLIGKRGENIDKLIKHLGIKVEIQETKDSIEDYIIPCNPDDIDMLSEIYTPWQIEDDYEDCEAMHDFLDKYDPQV